MATLALLPGPLLLAHASMIMPPPRNAIDSETPAWSHGKHPMTGTIEPYSCSCVNGTEPECNSGQACFWFSQGCTIGCAACDGNGSRIPNFDHCPDAAKPNETMPVKYWSMNQRDVVPGSLQDVFQFNPWRAPGTAPVSDPCGMAGGSSSPKFNAGEYNATAHAKQGDLGSKVLPRRPSGTVWTRGGTAKARWQYTASHGGGYQYRLCPASEPLTEACFQKHPLEFALPHAHAVVYERMPPGGVRINATVVAEGAYKGWMLNPIPSYGSDYVSCDYVVPKGEHCDWKCPGCGPPTYAADGACPCKCAERYPGVPSYVAADPEIFPDPLPGFDVMKNFQKYAIEDTLVVPTHLPAGEYVLGWRWDAEQTSQVWSSCSDITIV